VLGANAFGTAYLGQAYSRGAGTTYLGESATPIAVGITTAGTPKKFAATTTPLVLTVTTAGAQEVRSDLVHRDAVDRDDRQADRESATATPLTFSATTAGTRKTFGVTSTSETLTVTTTGKLGAKAATASTYTLTISTTGKLTAFSSSAVTETLSIGTTGKLGAKGVFYFRLRARHHYRRRTQDVRRLLGAARPLSDDRWHAHLQGRVDAADLA
jgi:hypothetical protein